MKTRFSSALLSVRFFSVLILLLTALQITGGNGYAASVPASHPSQTDEPPQPFICTNSISRQYCDMRVVLLIDDTGSMEKNPGNDRTRIRYKGAKNLVDILLREYYQSAVDARANDPNVELPVVEVAVIHFSRCDPNHTDAKPEFNCDTDVKRNSGWLPITERDEIDNAIDWDQPSGFYGIDQNTFFTEPFEAAATLMNQPSAANTKDCIKRFMLLLTDGTPQNSSGTLTGTPLQDHMNAVEGIVKDFTSEPDNEIYVLGFKIVKYYWDQVVPRWNKIAGSSNVTQAGSLDQVARRMEEIVAATIGAQTTELTHDPNNQKRYQVRVLPHTTSLRISYFKTNPNATLTITDPQDNNVLPNDSTVVGKGTEIEVWTLIDPLPGDYQILSTVATGIITTTPQLHVSAQLAAPTADTPLLQFASGLIRFNLVDSRGKPVLPGDFPSDYKLTVTAEVTQKGTSTPLELAQDGESYQASWIPLLTNPASVAVSLDLSSAGKVSMLNCQGGIGDFTVDPVTVTVTAPDACTDLNSPVTIPLQVVDEQTGKASGIDLDIDWQVDSVTSPGRQKVDSSVKTLDAKTGQYELRLTPVIEEDINSHISASVLTGSEPIQIFDGDITIPVCVTQPPPPPPPPCQLYIIVFWLLLIALFVTIVIARAVNRKRKGEYKPQRPVQFRLLVFLLIAALVVDGLLYWYYCW